MEFLATIASETTHARTGEAENLGSLGCTALRHQRKPVEELKCATVKPATAQPSVMEYRETVKTADARRKRRTGHCIARDS